MTFRTRHISVSINRPVREVYEFVSNPANLPLWAAGLSGSIEQVDGDWIAESPMGRVKVAFARTNEFGVLDHEVTLPDGTTVDNPVRVFPNNDGSELIFTVYQRTGVSDQMFADDIEAISRDLATLKALLEE